MKLRHALPVVALILGSAACGGSDENGKTEGISQMETAPGFSDVFVYCDDGDRVFLTQDDVQSTSDIFVIRKGCMD